MSPAPVQFHGDSKHGEKGEKNPHSKLEMHVPLKCLNLNEYSWELNFVLTETTTTKRAALTEWDIFSDSLYRDNVILKLIQLPHSL